MVKVEDEKEEDDKCRSDEEDKIMMMIKVIRLWELMITRRR